MREDDGQETREPRMDGPLAASSSFSEERRVPVLIVGDDDIYCELLGRLPSSRCQLFFAATSEELLLHSLKGPRVIVAAGGLPGLDELLAEARAGGAEIVEVLWDERPLLRAGLATASADPEAVVAAVIRLLSDDEPQLLEQPRAEPEESERSLLEANRRIADLESTLARLSEETASNTFAARLADERARKLVGLLEQAAREHKAFEKAMQQEVIRSRFNREVLERRVREAADERDQNRLEVMRLRQALALSNQRLRALAEKRSQQIGVLSDALRDRRAELKLAEARFIAELGACRAKLDTRSRELADAVRKIRALEVELAAHEAMIPHAPDAPAEPTRAQPIEVPVAEPIGSLFDFTPPPPVLISQRRAWPWLMMAAGLLGAIAAVLWLIPRVYRTQRAAFKPRRTAQMIEPARAMRHPTSRSGQAAESTPHQPTRAADQEEPITTTEQAETGMTLTLSQPPRDIGAKAAGSPVKSRLALAREQRSREVAAALRLIRRGRPAEARAYLARALRRRDDGRVRKLLAESYEATHELWPAAYHLEKAVEKTPRARRLYLRLGDIYLQLGQRARACSAFKRALAGQQERPKNLASIERSCGG